MEFDRQFIREAVLEETHDAVQRHSVGAVVEVAEHYVASAGVARLLAEAAQDFSLEPSDGVDSQALAEFVGNPDEEATLLQEAATVAEEVVTNVLNSDAVSTHLTEQLDDLSKRISPGTYALPKDASDKEYAQVVQQLYADEAANTVRRTFMKEREAAQEDEDWSNLYTRPTEAAENVIAKYGIVADSTELLLEEAQAAMAVARKNLDVTGYKLARFMHDELQSELDFGDAGYSGAELALEDIQKWNKF